MKICHDLLNNLVVGNIGSKLVKSVEKLSTRIGQLGDAVSSPSNLNTSLLETDQAMRNAQDGLSLLNVADRALESIQPLLSRLREMVSANTGDASPLSPNLQVAAAEICGEMSAIIKGTKFRGNPIFDATEAAALWSVVNRKVSQISTEVRTSAKPVDPLLKDAFCVFFRKNSAAQPDDGRELPNPAALMGADGFGQLPAALGEGADPSEILEKTDSIIGAVASQRSVLAAQLDRLNEIAGLLAMEASNVSSANSRIGDAGAAMKMLYNTKYSILSKAKSSLLVQANQSQQNIIGLIR